MRVRVAAEPAYAVAYVYLDVGETLTVEADAMVAMSDGIEVGAGVGSGGVVAAGLRRAIGGESFFVGTYRARVHGAWVCVAPPLPGDVTHVDLSDVGPVAVESGAYIASAESVKIDARWAGVKNIMLREGATILKAEGSGLLLFGSYGALQPFDLGAGQTMIIDAGHLTAWSADMAVDVGVLGGAVTSAATREGLVARFTGPGRVWMQTRKERNLESLFFPNRDQNARRR